MGEYNAISSFSRSRAGGSESRTTGDRQCCPSVWRAEGNRVAVNTLFGATTVAALTFIAAQSAAPVSTQQAPPPPGAFDPPPIDVLNPDVNSDGARDTLVGDGKFDAAGDPVFSIDVIGGAPGDVGGGVLFTVTSPEKADTFGSFTTAPGDLDGDGEDDFIVAAPFSGDPLSPSGKVYAYSGGRHTLLWSFAGQPGETMGTALAPLGDVTGDGVPDIAIGAGASNTAGENAGRVYVLSGSTGLVIHTVDGTAAHAVFGNAITGLGDVDGDGVPDYAVGAPSDPSALPNALGAATIRAGATGALIIPCASPNPSAGDGFGASLASVGDVTGDGVRDFVATAPGAGKAFTLSGADCSVVATMSGAPGETFGIMATPRAIAGDVAANVDIMSIAPDANGDGLPESRSWVFVAATGALLFIEDNTPPAGGAAGGGPAGPAGASATIPLPSDVNASGTVTTADLAAVLTAVDANADAMATPGRADVTGDGVVNAADAMAVISNLGGTGYTTNAVIVSECLELGTNCPCDNPTPQDLASGACDPLDGGGAQPPPAQPRPDVVNYVKDLNLCDIQYTIKYNSAGATFHRNRHLCWAAAFGVAVGAGAAGATEGFPVAIAAAAGGGFGAFVVCRVAVRQAYNAALSSARAAQRSCYAKAKRDDNIIP